MARKKKVEVEVDTLLVIDDSSSMRNKRQAAAELVEKQLAEIGKMDNAKTFSLIVFGSRIDTKLSFVNPKNAEAPAYDPWQNSTALIDAMWRGLDHLEQAPKRKNQAYLMMVVTDGEDNASRHTPNELKERIQKLNATDRWTIVFNGVGRSAKKFAQSLGLSTENVLEFDDSTEGVKRLADVNTGALRSLSDEYASGQTATRGFYKEVKMAGVKTSDVKQDLVDVTNQYDIWDVKDEMRISDFVENVIGETWNPKENRGFYELSKGEKCVQDYKAILLQDMKTGKLYTGPQARTILGLDNVNEAVKPGDMGTWRVFVLSTSWTRNLKPKTKFAFRKQTATA